MRLWNAARTLWRRKRFEAELEEEIRMHREMSGEAAFGSTALAIESSREVWGIAWLESCQQDLRYALRTIRRSPAFAIGVIGGIGLALGLNTTMFSVFNAYVLRPYAVRDAHSLYGFTWHNKPGNWRATREALAKGFTWDQYQDLRTRKTVFSDVLATMGMYVLVDGRELHG